MLSHHVTVVLNKFRNLLSAKAVAFSSLWIFKWLRNFVKAPVNQINKRLKTKYSHYSIETKQGYMQALHK